MQHKIKKHPVHHPLLRKYIKFFWEIRADFMQLNHKVIPSRNINLRFNLSDTPHFVITNEKQKLLEDVFFSGLQNQFTNTHLLLNGKVHMLGICFFPEGSFPFFKTPISEFKNQILGVNEVGNKLAKRIAEQLKNTPDTNAKLKILETAMVSLYSSNNKKLNEFQDIFKVVTQGDNMLISKFCAQHNISMRKLERMFNKYVGIPAKTYFSIDRFQNSMNQLLYCGYDKLSDIAYENGYFDQMHYIKEFQRFAGNTPTKFIKQRNSMLQVGKFS